MSKTTKIIAALGVVAGLGVAALPAFTYATESVSGTVDVYAEVLPAIAMTITGNNDGNAYYGESGDNAAVNVKSPSAATMIGSTDISTFETTASKNSSTYTKLLPNSSVHGSVAVDGVNGNFASAITVYTNNQSGYTLGIEGQGASGALGALTQIVDSGTAATIAADGIVKAGHSGWGYSKTAISTDAADASIANYQTAKNTSLTTTSAPTTGGDLTTVYYGVSTAADQATGVYHATVTYTATTNN